MSKKKKIIIIVSVLLAILLSFIGGKTFSKYLTQVKGEGIAEIASWDFKVNGRTDDVQTISLSSTFDNETLIGNKIAPGTKGSFNINLDATGSEVGINYKVTFDSETQKPTNLKFKYNDTSYNSIKELESALTGTINANDSEKTKTFTINWEWPFETGSNPSEINQNDKIDTQEAQTISNYTFNVNVQGVQVSPK